MNVNIIIPVENPAELRPYYRDVLLFQEYDGDLLLPVGTDRVRLRLMVVTEESKRLYPPKKNFPIFSFSMKKNFLSYCLTIYHAGAIFESVGRGEYGYYAHISDPDGNRFEVSCMGLDGDNEHIAAEEMPAMFHKFLAG